MQSARQGDPQRDAANTLNVDPHEQLRALYMTLNLSQQRFDEFKQLLALYPDEVTSLAEEPDHAAALRKHLNLRISEWIGCRFFGLSAAQILLWRAILVDERFNVTLSPWKESNGY